MLPVARTHRTPFHQPHRQLLILLSKSISQIFTAALPDQFRDQIALSLLPEIRCALLYHFNALALRAHRRKDFRVLCLGNAEIEIAMKLLSSTVIVRVDHLRLCAVADCSEISDHFGCKDHILIEDRMAHKTAKLLIAASAVQRTDI